MKPYIDIHRSTKELVDTSTLKLHNMHFKRKLQNCKICIFYFYANLRPQPPLFMFVPQDCVFAMESNCLGRWWMFWTCQINSFEKENCRSFFFCHSHPSLLLLLVCQDNNYKMNIIRWIIVEMTCWPNSSWSSSDFLKLLMIKCEQRDRETISKSI